MGSDLDGASEAGRVGGGCFRSVKPQIDTDGHGFLFTTKKQKNRQNQTEVMGLRSGVAVSLQIKKLHEQIESNKKVRDIVANLANRLENPKCRNLVRNGLALSSPSLPSLPSG